MLLRKKRVNYEKASIASSAGIKSQAGERFVAIGAKNAFSWRFRN